MGLFAGTEWDRPPHCENCGELETECVCPPVDDSTPLTPPQKQTARLAIEKRKRGKAVTVVRDLADEADHLTNLLTKIKTACGAGGTLKEGVIEIQGRQLDRVREVLTQLGYRTKG